MPLENPVGEAPPKCRPTPETPAEPLREEVQRERGSHSLATPRPRGWRKGGERGEKEEKEEKGGSSLLSFLARTRGG